MLYTVLKWIYGFLICKPTIAYWLVLHEIAERTSYSKVILRLDDFSIVHGTKPPAYCSAYDISQIRVIGPFDSLITAGEYQRLLKR